MSATQRSSPGTPPESEEHLLASSRRSSWRVLRFSLAAFTVGFCFDVAAIGQHKQQQELLDPQIINKKLDKLLEHKTWKSPELWIPIIGTLFAAVGGWAVAFQTLKRTVEEQRTTQKQLFQAHLADQVANSLKWFEGGSQKRSIGIADIETHIGDQTFRPFYTTWAAILVNQAIYLLVESDQTESLHERDNLERILNLLPRLPVTSYAPVIDAYELREQRGKNKGVPLSNRIKALVRDLPEP
jgi:hypothetical protein